MKITAAGKRNKILSALAGYPPPPDPGQLPSGHFVSPGCNASIVQTAADTALQDINHDRREGYILGLQRIFDVHEFQREHDGSVFYLTLDVLETECHVLSRKYWKDCNFRPAHLTVYGQCKIIISIGKKMHHLYNYDCVLGPVSARAISRICPDCPSPGDPTQARFLEAANVTLTKFNKENNHMHYFALLNVTKASSQWVIGPSAFVEYTIQETSCKKNAPVPDLSNCPLLPSETAETGLCRGSVVVSRIDNQEFVRVDCEFFKPQSPVTDEQKPQRGKDGHHNEDESHEDGHQGHSRGKGQNHRHPHPHHRHPHHQHHSHDHKHHDNHSHEHEEHPQHPPSVSHTSSEQEKSVGRVIVLPPSSSHPSLHSLPEIEPEQLDGKPVPPEQNPNLPDIHSAPEEGHPRPGKPPGRPGFTKPTRPDVPPFPTGFSHSETCPGNTTIEVIGVTLPPRPAGVPPSVATVLPKLKE
ncbi:fetuin-B isoform X2 [Hemicordylus capensis]|uniref:fetuin-B isoform X2 n=1 Tax=Hemicordylus capensis TaxID=884348 RepID=UPI002302F3F1|nr:fetuin-B isoform X2 [Hemicordylus capensis]